MKISVVIPTFNEEQAIGDVVRAVPAERVHEIIVVDNGSTDDTASRGICSRSAGHPGTTARLRISLSGRSKGCGRGGSHRIFGRRPQR